MGRTTRYRRTWLSALKCALGLHRLHIIQRFGAAAHIGCPYCKREWGMHDGIRAFVPWDGDIEEMYVATGCDVDGQRQAWLRDPYPINPNGPARPVR